MIENLFAGEGNLLVLLLSLLFRFLRSGHDGLSQRAAFMRKSAHGYNLYTQVGAWPWHIVNWAGRDLFIAVTYLYLVSNGVHGLVIAAAIVLNWLLHDFAYWLFCSRREQFQWGQGWPSFPSLFKHIFSFRRKLDATQRSAHSDDHR